MLSTRVIPCLLLKGRGLVKTIKFKGPSYVGDPVNVVKIFNDKEVDELMLLDITATPEGRGPAFEVVEEVANWCFMPLACGGGVRSLEDMRRLYALGVEKVVLNSAAHADPELVTAAARRFGSQSVLVSMDVGRTMWGKQRVFIQGGRKNTGQGPVDYARRMAGLGAGELLLTSMERDGTMAGYDLELIKEVAQAVDIPVIACGGAGRVEDFGQAVKQAGASAVAAGSMVVYQGRARGVLINFPTQAELKSVLD